MLTCFGDCGFDWPGLTLIPCGVYFVSFYIFLATVMRFGVVVFNIILFIGYGHKQTTETKITLLWYRMVKFRYFMVIMKFSYFWHNAGNY